MARWILCYVAVLLIFNNISAQGASREDLKKMMAAMINLQGHLCAEIIQVTPLKLKNTYEVTCIEFRGGKGTVEYLFALRADHIVVEER